MEVSLDESFERERGCGKGGHTQRMTTASVKMEPMTWKPSLLSSLPIKSVERSSDAKGKTSAHQPIWKKKKSQGQDRQRRQELKGENSGRTLKGRFPSRHRTQSDPQATNMNQI